MSEKATGDKFFIVMRDRTRTSVGYRHATRLSANAEADRLCEKERERFYVLESVRKSTPLRGIIVSNIS